MSDIAENLPTPQPAGEIVQPANTGRAPALKSAAVALLNLTGLSLGYFYMRRFVRGGIHLAITLAILLVGMLTAGLHIAPIIVIGLVLFLIWMAVDGFRLARRDTAAGWLPIPAAAGLAVALVVLALEGAGFAAYSSSGQGYYEQGEQAYARSDYAQSYSLLQTFTTVYHLSLNANLPAAETLMQESELLSRAAVDCKNGNFEQGLKNYQTYLESFPTSTKQAEAHSASAQAYFDWAATQQANGEYEQAVAHYETILANYAGEPVSAQTHEPLGLAYLQWADDLRSSGERKEAITRYEKVIADFADTPSLDAARLGAAQSMLEIAQAEAQAGNFELAVTQYQSILDQYADLPAAEIAKGEIPQSYLNWGNELLAEKNYALAVAQYETILKNYKQSIPAKEALEGAGKAHLALGTDYLSAGNFEQAVAELEQVITTYARTTSVKEGRIKAAEAYLGLGKQAAASGDYVTALESFDKILNDLGNSPSAAEARSASIPVRMQAAAMYREQGKPAQAADLYQQIITNNPKSAEAIQAAEELPGAYLEWARGLIAEKKFQDSQDLLDTITTQYASSTAATQVPSATVELNAAWGQELVQQSQFIEAINKLSAAKEALSDPALLKSVEEALNRAIQGLANDSGKQGQQVIAEAIEQACAYQKVTSPAVGILPDSLHAVSCAKSVTLDEKFAPTRPGDFHYAVFVKEGYTEIERCRYGYYGSFYLIRQQIHWDVTLRDVVSGQTYQFKTFTGGMPDKCPPSWRFYSLPDYLNGTYPDSIVVAKWVQSYLKP